jgi:putative endonuclease
MKQYFVYIMSNKARRLYVGITSKLYKRVFQHKNKLLPGFTSRYNFDMLVYYEEFSQVVSAITREKEIKGWRREKKLKLILAENPDWADLSLEWEEDPSWKALSGMELRPRLRRRPQN